MRALRRRAARRAKDGAMVDMNLVSLIDVFTILIFFLLAHSMDVQTLLPPAGVQLPLARAEQPAHSGIELAVSGHQVLLQGRVVATLSEGGLLPLSSVLAARVAQQPSTPLLLVADRELPYHWLRALMRSAADAGLHEVSLAVRREEGA